MSPPEETASATLEDLRRVPVLRGLPDDVLRWVLEHGEIEEHSDGDVITRTGDSIDHLWLLLEGAFEFYMDVNGRLTYYYTFSHDPPSEGAGGLIPYSRLKASPGWAYAKGRVRGVRLHKSHFRELESISPELVQRLIGTMTERARTFATRKLQEEKISALGKLAAGLAHELNNPAAAIQRSAAELSVGVTKNYELTPALLVFGMSAEELRSVQEIVLGRAGTREQRRLTLSERMRAEEELVERLVTYGIEQPEPLAEVLLESGVDAEALEQIRTIVGGQAFTAAIRWLCNLLRSTRVIRELEEAASRISALVGAIKSHVHMDRSGSTEPVDILSGIDNTLVILGHKIRSKNIQVSREYEKDLPRVLGHAGELNQVWTNLIDNAIDALDRDGKLSIRAGRNDDRVRIVVEDDGSGIPAEIQGRIFDPFFTTKRQGEGTGMGLDIVMQAVNRHHGEIKVHSRPGETRFQVTLAITPPERTDRTNEEPGAGS